jgi:hypothetical protein
MFLNIVGISLYSAVLALGQQVDLGYSLYEGVTNPTTGLTTFLGFVKYHPLVSLVILTISTQNSICGTPNRITAMASSSTPQRNAQHCNKCEQLWPNLPEQSGQPGVVRLY